MQPHSPNPDFDFMFKNNQVGKPNARLAGLPKPLKIGLAVVVGIILLVIVSSLLSGHNKGSTTAIEGVLARNAEILRVTGLVQQQLPLQDPQTQALAATVSSSLTSDKTQLLTYLSQNHVKMSASLLAIDVDKTTDTSLQAASQNNSIDSAYVSYLKQALSKYQSDLQTAYKSAGPNGKKLLQTAFDSTNTLLSVPPLKA
jgi:hypothetical protein